MTKCKGCKSFVKAMDEFHCNRFIKNHEYCPCPTCLIKSMCENACTALVRTYYGFKD